MVLVGYLVVKMVTQRSGDERAVVMVEFLIGLPLFLFGVLFLLWYAYTYHTRNALALAAYMGPRLGYTRADYGTLASKMNWGTGIPDLLATPGEHANALGFYQTKVSQEFPAGTNFQNLPASYHYALAYAYQTLELGLGNIRYPCDEAGCVRCYNINRAVNTTPPSTQEVAIMCEYSMSNVLLAPVVGLMNLMSGTNPNYSFVFRATDFFPGDPNIQANNLVGL